LNRIIVTIGMIVAIAITNMYSQTNTIQLRNGSNTTTILPSASSTIAVQIPALSAGTHYLLTSTTNPGSSGAAGSFITYGATSAQNTLDISATNYLFNVGYAATAVEQVALGGLITSTATGTDKNATALTLAATGTGTGTSTALYITNGRLTFTDSDDSHTTSFTTGNQTSNITYTLPQSDGTNGQVLSTNGSGTLTWATSTSVASINDLTDAKNSGLNFSHSLALGSEPSGTLNNAEFNTAVGVYSMLNITSGDHNVALGYGSLNLLNSGSQNTAVGSTAGQSITTGTQNVCLGFEAGKTLTTGTGNVFIGHQTGSAVAVGTSNTLMISNSNDATPLIYGDFSTDQLTLNGHVEVAIGTTTSTVPFSILGTGIQGASNVENAYLGTDVPTLFVRNTTNSADANAVLLVGVGGSGSASSAGDAYLSLDVATVGGWSMGIDNSDSDKLKFLDSWDFKSDGGTPAYGLPVMTMTRLTRRVGIGTENPAYMLDVAGDIQANTTVYTSDARLKRNVQPIGNALGTVAKLRPVSYEKRADLRSNDYSMKQMGFIAQELESVLPNSVHTDKSADAIKSVDYISIIPVLTKALQEQQELIAKQQELIAKQQELVAKQQQEIDELKKMVKRMSLR
jgi:hypothetical protein